jgi:uncharacterized membrane protein
MTFFGSDIMPYVALIICGFLPSEIWRWLAVLVGRGLDETSELLTWVRAVATATLAAVVAKLAFFPAGALATVPTGWRVAALASGVVVFFAFRRSVLLGVVVGEAILVGSAWYLGLVPSP